MTRDHRGATWTAARASRGRFAELMAQEMLQGNFMKADLKTDMDAHIDLWYRTDNGILGADIKSIKAGNDNMIFVELLNSYGLKGWIYGRADHIWFERFESFYLVRRTRLLEFVNSMLPKISPEPTGSPAVWRYYQRQIRHHSGQQTKDLTLVLPVTALEEFAFIREKTVDQIRRTREFYQAQRG